jgi:amino acid transporter
MAYLSMMIVVWNVMNNLAEIVTYLPMNGITIPYFVKRFVDPSLAFAAGESKFDDAAIMYANALQAGTTGMHMRSSLQLKRPLVPFF